MLVITINYNLLSYHGGDAVKQDGFLLDSSSKQIL